METVQKEEKQIFKGTDALKDNTLKVTPVVV
jgi:hypothetical protein